MDSGQSTATQLIRRVIHIVCLRLIFELNWCWCIRAVSFLFIAFCSFVLTFFDRPLHILIIENRFNIFDGKKFQQLREFKHNFYSSSLHDLHVVCCVPFMLSEQTEIAAVTNLGWNHLFIWMCVLNLRLLLIHWNS